MKRDVGSSESFQNVKRFWVQFKVFKMKRDVGSSESFQNEKRCWVKFKACLHLSEAQLFTVNKSQTLNSIEK